MTTDIKTCNVVKNVWETTVKQGIYFLTILEVSLEWRVWAGNQSQPLVCLCLCTDML